jgi:hypothetical protein
LSRCQTAFGITTVPSATFDLEHIVTYFRLLDADAEGADWRDVAGS